MSATSDRYARQTRVPGVGEAGQRRLAEARVLLVGAGGLGSPAGQYLAAAGIGTIGIVDDDRVELSNLHRQVLHRTEDVGRPKVESAADALRALNPEVTIVTHDLRLTAATVMDVVAGYDAVVDGADSFATRYVVSDACTLLDIPHVWAAVLTDGGQMSVFHASRGPVYRDLLPVMPPAGAVPSCAVAGVLGTVPGVLGTAMAGEVLKLVLGIGEPAVGRVLVYDMLTAEWETVPLMRSPQVARPQTAADVGRGVPSQVTVAQVAEAVSAPRVSRASDGRRDRRGTGERSEGPASAPVPRTTDPSLAEDVRTGALIVDVRTPAEAAAGMIPGARLLPLDRIESAPEAAAGQLRAWADAWAEEGAALTGPADVYVHCRAGARSARALELLAPLLEHEAVVGDRAVGSGRPGDAADGAPVGDHAPVDDHGGPQLRLHDVVGGYEAWSRTFPDQHVVHGEFTEGPEAASGTA